MSSNNPPYHPPLSSSSSRQSLRREPASRPDTASRPNDGQSHGQLPDRRLSTGATHQLVETPEHPTHDEVLQDTEEGHEHQPGPQPAFQPFFTLIENAHTSDYHHPTVHYIFSDDDTDIVTEAALRSLAAQQEEISDSRKEQIAQNQASHLHNGTKDSSSLDLAKSTLLPPPVPGVRDNYIILDIEPIPATTGAAQTNPITEQLAPGKGGGTKSISSSPANPSALPPDQSPIHPQYRVTAAQSFSSTWQVLNTDVMPAPTFENSDPGESPAHGLMLKIRGTSGFPIEDKGRDKEGKLEEMMDQFAKRMSELQVIIDAAETADAARLRDEHVEEVEPRLVPPDIVEDSAKERGDNTASGAEIEVE